MLHKICNFDPSSHILAILGTKMVQKWDFLKNPANPYDEIFLEGLVSHCGQISVWIMDLLCPAKSWGHAEKKPPWFWSNLVLNSCVGMGSNPTSDSLVLVPTYYEQ